MLSHSIANSLAKTHTHRFSSLQLPRGHDLLSSTRAATHQVPAGQESLQENQFHHSLQKFVFKFEQ